MRISAKEVKENGNTRSKVYFRFKVFGIFVNFDLLDFFAGPRSGKGGVKVNNEGEREKERETNRE